MSTIKNKNVEHILNKLKYIKKFNTWKDVAEFLGESEAVISVWRKRNSPSAIEKILYRCGPELSLSLSSENDPEGGTTSPTIRPEATRQPHEYGLLENAPTEQPRIPNIGQTAQYTEEESRMIKLQGEMIEMLKKDNARLEAALTQALAAIPVDPSKKNSTM
jgi:hypothetical protein